MNKLNHFLKLYCYGRLVGNLLTLSVLTGFLLAGCNGTTEKTPDVSAQKISLNTYRFDKDLYAIDTNHVSDGLKNLAAKYPDFLNFYLDTILGYGIHGNFVDTAGPIREGLRVFLTYKDYVGLEDTIKTHYPDTKEIEKQLTDGFKYLKHYYPNQTIPKVMFVNLGLNRLPAFTIDTSILGISLDMFLGPQYPYYRSVGIPDYMGAHMRPFYIPVAAFSVIYSFSHPFVSNDRTLLDLMLQRGKEQYFLHKILPNTPDSVLFGFTQQQLNWCNANEAMTYNFFIHQNLLYSKEVHNTLTYVNDGPYARGLEPVTDVVKTTPGNIGTWLGYKIVSAYMEQHPEVSLAQLLSAPLDAAKMLDDAKYRPK